jgi:hypothetical protein
LKAARAPAAGIHTSFIGARRQNMRGLPAWVCLTIW